MKIGIIGLPGIGKTTLFNALTKSSASTNAGSGKSAPNIATIKVPDERIDFLAGVYKPKKTSYANVEFVDLAGVLPGSSKSETPEGNLLNAARAADVLCHVVRAYDEKCENFLEPIDIIGDIKKINDELLLADLAVIEGKLSRMATKKKAPGSETEQKLLEKLKAHLESEQMLFTYEFTKDDDALVQGYKFLSQKNQVVVLNIDESYIKIDLKSKFPDAMAYLEKQKVYNLAISAKLEMDISQLDGDDEKLFLTENSLSEPGRNRLIRKAYEVLGNISFFTAGEDEVKAWTITKGMTAHDAAGKIHSDIQRGFIRAEVVTFKDCKECGSVEAAHAKGKMKLEQKTFVVSDGDIVHFRFNT